MFDTIAERAAALRENDELSIVSYTKSDNVVDIKMPVDPLEAPFFIDNLTDYPNVVEIWKAYASNAESVRIEKSANMKRWVFVENSGYRGGAKITIPPQGRIYLRFSLDGEKLGTLSGTRPVPNEISPNRIDASRAYAIGGNILSLLNGPLYVPGERLFNSYQITSSRSKKDDYIIGTYAGLFENSTNLVDASKLILPDNVTTYKCYYHMFKGCTGLTTAPALPATVTATNSYQAMFVDCTSLTTLPMIKGNEIYGGMFYNCTGFVSVDVPQTVTTIASDAFTGALNVNYTGSATGSPWGAKCVNGYVDGNLVYSDSTKTILIGCKKDATAVTIPNSVTTIDANAFNGCGSLPTITIPDTVTTIGNNAFYNVSNIVYNGSATGSPWGALCVNGYVDGDLIYTDSTKTNLVSCVKSVTDVTIPATVTSIGANAFNGCNLLSEIVVPSGVTSIGQYAFANCDNMFECKILATTPPAITNKNVFENSSNVAIEVPQGYIDAYNQDTYWSQLGTRITDGKYLIEYTSIDGEIVNPYSSISPGITLLSNTYADGVGYYRMGRNITSLYSTAFKNCVTLTSIELPNTLTEIGSEAFSGCSGIISLDVPATVTTIGNNAFYGIININYTGSATGSPWGALCVNGYVDGDLIYTDSTKTNLVKCMPTATDVTIPNTVTSIGENAFKSCENLTNIVIPDTVTSLGIQCFYSCGNLASAVIGNGVTNIPIRAFSFCDSLVSVTLPNTITTIDTSAFSKCTSLASVTLPNGVTYIGSSAFEDCSGLTSVTIPNSVITIKNNAFDDCTGVASIDIPDTVETIEGNAFRNVMNINYHGSATGSPWGAKNMNGYIDGDYVYTDSTKTVLSGYIGTATTITLPNNALSINSNAFSGNTTLISVTIPDSVTSIGGSAFSECSALTLVNLSPNITSIGNSVFYNCTSLMGNMDIPEGVTSISHGLFKNCSSLRNVTFPNNLTTIGGDAFNGCSSLNSISLPDTLTSIGGGAFNGCANLTGNITIPNGVTTISSYTFSECTGLDNIIVPNTVTSIGTDAFKNVANIIYTGTATGSPWGAKYKNGYCENGFIYTNNTKTELKKYVGTATSVGIPNTVTTIAQDAFRNNTNILSVDIPDSVTTLGTGAFTGCSNLETVVVPNTITTMGGSVFASTGLIAATIPSSITAISGGMFSNCDLLASVVIPSNITSIGSSAFSGCEILGKVVIPASVTNIGGNAFDNLNYKASITCKATTPPTLGSNVFEPTFYLSSPNIYVPSASLSTYKSASGWSDYAQNIYPMSNGIELSQGMNVATIDITGITSGTGYYTINGGSQVSVGEGTTTVPITQSMNGQTLLVHGTFDSETKEETLVLSWIDYAPAITITENKNYVTIDAPVANTIQYRLGSSGEYINYTEPVYIAADTTIYVTATRILSGISYTSAKSQNVTHILLPPTNLRVGCLNNIVTITADGADSIAYRFNGSGIWTVYTEPFVINQNVTLNTKATNNDGTITKSQSLTYVDYAPAVTISETDNYVTIVSETADTIQYKLGTTGEYTDYTAPVYIAVSTVMYVEATRDVSGIVYITNVSQSVTHTAILPSNLVISCSNNFVTITADYADTIEYNFDGSSNYTTYTEPFEITETVTVYAKATNMDGSITASQECEYDNRFTPFYIEDVSGSNNTISIKKSYNSSNVPTLSIQKSLDGVTWESMGSTSTAAITATVPANGKLYLRCSTNSWSNGSASYYNYFSGSTGNFNVGGNIMSLLYGSSFNGQTAFKANYTYIFTYLFKSTKIVSAAKLLLPATTLYNNCYYYMFYNCTALTTAPATLPATTLAQECYYGMFQGCTALTTAPSILPATTLANSCYYNMFRSCTSLTTAPELPATTVVYQCYYYMFQDCSNLNYVKCLLTNPQTNYSSDWLSGVASSGKFIKSPNVTWATGVSGIPSGWTVLTKGITLLQSLNVATIETVELDSGTGYYTINGGSHIPITESTTNIPITQAMNGQTLLAYGELNGEPEQKTLTLSWTDYSPAVTITETDNFVTITSPTADSITYRLGSSGEYTNYTEPVYIAADTTIYVIATRTVSGIVYTTNDSQAVTHTVIPPSNLTITCLGTLVVISATNATTLEYNFDGSSTYTTYTQPFAISQTVTVYAKATNVDGSITASQECIYNAYGVPFYIEDVSGSDNTISIRGVNNNAPKITIEKSLDCINWESMGTTSTTAITATVPANGKLYLRCSTNAWTSDTNKNNYNRIVSATSNFNVGGNINSLLYGSSFNGQTEFPSTVQVNVFYKLFETNAHVINAVNLKLPSDTLKTYCYYGMFYGCTGLTTAPATLPATNLTTNCYDSMFYGCTALTTPPTLPATTLTSYCYSNMFQGCTSLTSAPALPATTLASYCYSHMFDGCSALTTAPTTLTATTLADYCCQYMFQNCTSLTTVPVLPATTLANHCYFWMFAGCSSLTTAPALLATDLTNYCYCLMFANCTSLVNAPALSATTLAQSCYSNMFDGCTSLVNAPVLPATTLAQGCYAFMFRTCTSLTYIKCLATDISATNCTKDWVKDVTASGTFVKNPSMSSWTTGTYGIPSGWTVQDATA